MLSLGVAKARAGTSLGLGPGALSICERRKALEPPPQRGGTPSGPCRPPQAFRSALYHQAPGRCHRKTRSALSVSANGRPGRAPTVSAFARETCGEEKSLYRVWKGESQARNPAAGEEDEQPQIRAPGPRDPAPPPEHKERPQRQPPSPVAVPSARGWGGGNPDLRSVPPARVAAHLDADLPHQTCGLCKAETRPGEG